MAHDAETSNPATDQGVFAAAGRGLTIGTGAVTLAYGVLESAGAGDPHGLDQTWEAISPFYQPTTEVATNALQIGVEHARHIAELTATIGPAAVALFVGGNLSIRSAREFGEGKPMQGAAHFAGSLVCYAFLGGWSTGSRILATSGDVMHDPRGPATLATAGFLH